MSATAEERDARPRSRWVAWASVAFVGWFIALAGGGLLLFYLRPDPEAFAGDLVDVRRKWGFAIGLHSVGGLVALVGLVACAAARRAPRVVRIGFGFAAVVAAALWATGHSLGQLGDTSSPPALLGIYLAHAALLPFGASAVALICFFLGLRSESEGRQRT